MLVALFHATGGPNWENKEGWLTNAPIGQWENVTVNEEGAVVRLSLNEDGLEGEMPPQLGNLTNLAILNLSGN